MKKNINNLSICLFHFRFDYNKKNCRKNISEKCIVLGVCQQSLQKARNIQKVSNQLISKPVATVELTIHAKISQKN